MNLGPERTREITIHEEPDGQRDVVLTIVEKVHRKTISEERRYPSIQSLMKEISREANLKCAQTITGIMTGFAGTLWGVASERPFSSILGFAICVGGFSLALSGGKQLNKWLSIEHKAKNTIFPSSKQLS